MKRGGRRKEGRRRRRRQEIARTGNPVGKEYGDVARGGVFWWCAFVRASAGNGRGWSRRPWVVGRVCT